MVKLSDFELGWLVGILEGEGYFRFQGTQYVVMASTDEDVVITCERLFSRITGHNFTIYSESKDGRKDIFKIAATGKHAKRILETIVPYMHYRRRAKAWQVINRYRETKKLTLEQAGIDIQSLFNPQKV